MALTDSTTPSTLAVSDFTTESNSAGSIDSCTFSISQLFVTRQDLLCPRMLELRPLEKLRLFGELVQCHERPRGVWVV